jgi:hypothetical protein
MADEARLVSNDDSTTNIEPIGLQRLNQLLAALQTAQCRSDEDDAWTALQNGDVMATLVDAPIEPRLCWRLSNLCRDNRAGLAVYGRHSNAQPLMLVVLPLNAPSTSLKKTSAVPSLSLCRLGRMHLHLVWFLPMCSHR